MIYSNVTGTTAKEYAIGAGKPQEKRIVATETDIQVKDKNGGLTNIGVADPTLDSHSINKAYADKHYASRDCVFSATFLLDGWQKSGNTWVQTVDCPRMRSSFVTSPPWIYLTGNDQADTQIRQGLSIINNGQIETLDNQLKVTIYSEPPKCDVQIYVRRVDTPTTVSSRSSSVLPASHFSIDNIQTDIPSSNNQKETSVIEITDDGFYSFYLQMTDATKHIRSSFCISVFLNETLFGGHADDNSYWVQTAVSFFCKKGDIIKIEFDKGTRNNFTDVYTGYTMQKVLFM